MTKLKNTKKGMAKKALSVSLVAAMLATSNVPVWAAEDLFTDGSSAAVEAPVVEEPAAEVETFSSEVSEETTDAVQTQSTVTNNSYSVSPTFTGITDNSVVWEGSNVQANFSINASNGNTIPSNVEFYYAWKVDGLADSEARVDNTSDFTTAAPTLDANDAGKPLTLYIYAKDTGNNNNIIWEYTSDAISIESVDETAAMEENISLRTNSSEYTGESVDVASLIDWGNAVSSNYNVTVSGDTTNVTDDGITVTITANRTGYKGSIERKYTIEPKTLDGTSGNMISEHMEASLNTTSFTYTGNVIRVKATDVTLVDKDTGADLSNYLQADADGYVSLKNTTVQDVGETTFTLNLINGQPTSGVKNYKIAQSTGDADGYRTIQTSNEATITARDLSTVNITIKSKSIPVAGQKVTLEESDITYTDKTTGETLNLNADLNYEVPSNATQAGTYTVEFTPVEGNQNVTGNTTAELRLVVADLSGAKFSGSEATTAEEYTGDAVTKTEAQLGSLVLDGRAIDSSAYEITYANNINAGTAQIIVNGKGDFEGSQAIFTFTINKASVAAADVSTNNSVEYKDTQNAEDYKGNLGLTVKAKNADGKEFTLTEDEDYTVEYSFNAAGNKVNDGKVVADITITNNNFTGGTTTFTKEVTITAKALKSENIQLTQTTFTYNGKAIQPEFDVVIDGKIINPQLYTYTYSDNIDAGTGTLTVRGNGTDYSTAAATATFTINPADVSSLEGAIASKEYTGYSLTLAEDDFNLTLDGEKINVYDNFNLTYGTNVEIGEGTVTITPKNENFTGTTTLTFQIVGKALNDGGSFTFYENGIRVADKDNVFSYDGSAHEFDQTVFSYAGSENLVEGEDYDIVYVDNVYGKDATAHGNRTGQDGAVLAIAKGEYGSTRSNGYDLVNGVYTDAEGNTYTNVISVQYFTITQQNIVKSNVSVSNGTYAAGLQVEPNVSILVNGVLLQEGKDYELEYENDSDRTSVTNSNSLKVTVIPQNGYTTNEDLTFNWGIDKFNLANADVSVDGDTVTVKCGRVDVETSEYTITRDGNNLTVTAVEGSENYTGSKTINVETEDEKPGTPVITTVNVSGNNATVVLSGETDGATGYDFVISTDRDCINTKDYDKVNKNILSTETTFTYTEEGVYYAYCHAWKRVDGVKVFSDWSNAYPFAVTSITPEQPSITSVKKSGRNLTVTWTQCDNATGYDIVMGTELKKVNGETRPVEYGKAVKKITNGSTVTVTFRSIPSGTYYVGLHAYNRTSETGVKVFSPWSNTKKVTF